MGTSQFIPLLAAVGAALVAAVAYRRRQLDLRDPPPECCLLGVLHGDWPMLHLLAHRGQALLLEALLSLGGARTVATVRKWTALHCAAAQVHDRCAAALLAAGSDPGAKDVCGRTALLFAIAGGHSDVVARVLEARADANAQDHSCLTPLHAAALHGRASLVSVLVKSKAQLEAAQTKNGSTPLLMACAGPKSWPAVLPLLEARADASAVCHGMGTSALMLCAKWKWRGACPPAGDGSAELMAHAAVTLLEHGADPGLVDCFGQTALHHACRQGTPELVAALCAGGARADAQDNDGRYPLELLCELCVEHPEEEDGLCRVAMEAILSSEPRAARLLDFGDASALHRLCQHVALKEPAGAPLRAIRALLAAGAEVAREEEGGWTPAHFLAGSGKVAAKDALAVLQAEGSAEPGFWESWDARKPRDASNRQYLARRGGHHRLSPSDRSDVLRGDVSLAGVASRLLEGRSRRVVVLLGAGASTAAGIPDFRSPGIRRTPFSAARFVEDPEGFWRMVAELFIGRAPTKVHRLLALLASRGLLSRVYTQNIDCLEAAAGVPEDLVIQCHGSALRAVCPAGADRAVVPVTDFALAAKEAFEKATDWQAPRCSCCREIMRPDVVFFGEPLPEAYDAHWREDLKGCDLLLVIGTSLVVYPVAGLVKQVGPLVPRVLINRERAGLWHESGQENYRDVYWEGDCDVGAEELAHLLGIGLGGGEERHG